MNETSTETMKGSALIVDDDPGIRRALSDRLGFWGLVTAEARDGSEALKTSAKKEFDVVLLDLSMPGLTGMDVLKTWKADEYPADVVVLTAHGSVEAAVEAIRHGAADFLQKPADLDLLRRIVERSLEKRLRTRVNRAYADRTDDARSPVAGTSPSMARLLEGAKKVAASNATVLVTGESGSGKQVLAEFLHANSARKDGPFVYVNCVALSDDLIESTLFGHERGAFTGAVQKKEGRLETASGGTAFLDEIGDVSARLQTKLLHFLETGEFERVGGTRTLSVDCRIVAATNRDLEAAIKQGKFREDLYYRLNVVRLDVPPLRARAEDIPALSRAFAARFAREAGRGPVDFAARAVEILQTYTWPGNVRQLKNAIERMVVMASGPTLTPDLLPPEIFKPGVDPGLSRGDLPFHDAVEAFKRAYIGQALAKTGGNQTKAAAALGLQRTFLNRLIHELKVAGASSSTPPDGPPDAADADVS